MSWTKENLYHSSEAHFLALSNAIQNAKHSIDLEYYILGQDVLSYNFLTIITAAVKRGVKVRVLLDGIGSANWSYRDAKRLIPEISLRFFHPLPWQREGGWIEAHARNWLTGLWKLNRRNHRKLCIIDGKRAILGGHNISAQHSSWRDSSVSIEGSEVQILVQAFEMAWQNFDRLRQWVGDQPGCSSLVRLNVTPFQRKEILNDLIRRIETAKTRIWITNAYFIPILRLTRALRMAAQNGVDVKVLVPRKSDVRGIRWAIRSFYFYLLSSRIRIFEYYPSVLHAKIILIDGFATVGSSNLNHRSFLRDLEVDVVLESEKSISDIESQFKNDLEDSREVTLRSWSERTFIEKLLEFLAAGVRRWL